MFCDVGFGGDGFGPSPLFVLLEVKITEPDFLTTDCADGHGFCGRAGGSRHACKQAVYVPESGMTGYEKNWFSRVSGKRF